MNNIYIVTEDSLFMSNTFEHDSNIILVTSDKELAIRTLKEERKKYIGLFKLNEEDLKKYVGKDYGDTDFFIEDTDYDFYIFEQENGDRAYIKINEFKTDDYINYESVDIQE